MPRTEINFKSIQIVGKVANTVLVNLMISVLPFKVHLLEC